MGISGIICYVTFLVAYSVQMRIRDDDLESIKLRKMAVTCKRFRERCYKFRFRTLKERIERFDTILDDLNAYFQLRQRQKETEDEKERDKKLLKERVTNLITFEQWIGEKEKFAKLAGEDHFSKTLAESEKRLPRAERAIKGTSPIGYSRPCRGP